MKKTLLMAALAAAVVGGTLGCGGGKSANGLAGSGSAAINDSVLWFENTASIELVFNIGAQSIEISGTAEGAIAKYIIHWRDNRGSSLLYRIYAGDYDDTKEEEFLEVRLDMETWQNILKRLFNTGIRGWGKGSYDFRKDVGCISYITVFGDISWWDIYIFIRNSEDILVGACGWFAGDPPDMPNWSVFYGEMFDIIKNIINIPLDTEHKKRFGTPASDFEQYILLVKFEKTIVLKRMNGAIMAMNKMFFDPMKDEFNMDNWHTLDVSDWFDIIHALGNGACESDITADMEKPDSGKVLINYFTEKDSRISGREGYVTVSDGFKKVMDGITDRIKE